MRIENEMPRILFEDQEVIVVVKPPKMPCQKDISRDLDLQTYLKTTHKLKETFLIHRLDRPVGGIMVLAKTALSARVLSQAFAKRQADKKYMAVVNGSAPKTVDFEDYLFKNRMNISEVVSEEHPDRKRAKLTCSLMEQIEITQEEMASNMAAGIFSLVDVELHTGRHHQIRVQLAHHGLPIWGDTKYNSAFQKTEGWVQIALFAYELTFNHPKTKKIMTFKEWPSTMPFSLFAKPNL